MGAVSSSIQRIAWSMHLPAHRRSRSKDDSFNLGESIAILSTPSGKWKVGKLLEKGGAATVSRAENRDTKQKVSVPPAY